MSDSGDKLKAKIAARVAERKASKEAANARKARTRDRWKKRKQRRLARAAKAELERQKSPETKAEEWQAREEARLEREDDAARTELARREMARRHLLPFIMRMDPKYKPGWVHKDICLRLEKFLEDVVNELDPRLMLFVPPQHGKSTIVSHYFPPWALGKYPHLKFINTSYAESLQLEFSKKAQSVMMSPEYQILFPGVTIPKDHRAVSDWKVAAPKDNGTDGLSGGGLLAAGVGGPLSGRGAHIGTVDDPLKNRVEADSEVTREMNKSWYSSTFSTRLAPGGGILIIQTRWHDDDLSGWLLRLMESALKEERETGVFPEDADRWEVVSYPAIAVEDEKYRKKGEALHPERYNLKRLLRKKRSMVPRDWSALYQQNPVAEEGAYFTKEMIRRYNRAELPPIKTLNIYAAGDLAISKKETADYTVFVVVGLDEKDNLWVLDARRGRWDSDEITDQMIDIQKTWHPLRFGVEREKVLIAIGGLLNKKIREEHCYELVVEDLNIGGRDKRARARPIQGRMKQGQVLLPAEAEWVQTAINEMLRFDAGVNDDYVDAFAWIGQMLAEETYVAPRKTKEKPWRHKLKGYVKKKAPTRSGMAA